MSVQIIRGNALALPLADNSVDLVVTSPPYFGLRSYQDAGEHYDGQIGSEATPAEFVDALIAATAEMVRVVKPSGSIWVNLGDKYNSAQSGQNGTGTSSLNGHGYQGTDRDRDPSLSSRGRGVSGVRPKSLIGVPWRYALACIDDLGLILRAEVIWSKPNGLPESVTDRVRRSHETWFHFTLNPRYYSAVDEIREEHAAHTLRYYGPGVRTEPRAGDQAIRREAGIHQGAPGLNAVSPLGKLPGSVWTIPTQPLTVPPELGVDHFAAFPMEWPRRIVTGWSPREVCTACREGRRPVVVRQRPEPKRLVGMYRPADNGVDGRHGLSGQEVSAFKALHPDTITGYACACPHPTAPTTPGTVLDPFGGTGTTALVAHALGRHGISVDMSADYCRLAQWRTSDPDQFANAMQVDKPAKQIPGQADLFTILEGEPA